MGDGAGGKLGANSGEGLFDAVAAQDAARPPKDDEEAQGKTANAEKMNDARPKAFDKAAFIKAVEDAIAAKAPKNLDEAGKFADSGKPEEVRNEVRGRVGDGKSDSAEQIATTTAAPPDTSGAVTKQVVPMAPDRPPGTPATPNPADAIPDRQPLSATDMSAGPAQLDQQMADAQVTEPQLRESNEPTFKQAVQEKHKAEQHSEVTPPTLRQDEAAQLHAASTAAKREGTTAIQVMGSQRVRTGQAASVAPAHQYQDRRPPDSSQPQLDRHDSRYLRPSRSRGSDPRRSQRDRRRRPSPVRPVRHQRESSRALRPRSRASHAHNHVPHQSNRSLSPSQTTDLFVTSQFCR
ncbi:hypothetical protein [Actinocrispum sp. NPDC049592]|uniref:hypothetical protein n=1 Tax=Actinocrispum sp. NPDC049592 TaxID=3154835 RepID=UPI0034288EC3